MNSILGLTIFAWITLFVLLGKVYALIRAKWPGDIISYGIIAVLLLTGTMTTEQALGCFSVPSVVLIGVLSVVGAGLIHTGAIHWIVRHVMGTPKSPAKALIRLMLPVGALSAFLSNTAVVTMFITVVKMWAQKMGVRPSKFLIPLSYAASIGGMCTVIGTPANLILSSFYEQKSGQSMPFFSTLLPGACCLIVSIIALIAMYRLLPQRKSPEESFESSSDYTVELIVPADCEHIGESIQEAGLLNVPGGHLLEVVRFDREIISPVPPDEFILGNDHLVYSGQINNILELKNTHGLVNANHVVFSTNDQQRDRKLQMASVDQDSPLIGQRMEDSNFENHNNVVLVAVARNGERINAIPREIVLQPGDTLLLEGQRLLPENFQGSLNFFDNIALPTQDYRTIVSALIMVGMVLLSALNIMPLIKSAFLAALLMFITKCCNVTQLQQSINWKLIMSFAASVCLGNAIDITGLSEVMGRGLMNLGVHNIFFSLFLICSIATILTEFISNTSAAAILAPIAYSIAVQLDANPMMFIVAMMIAINCSFATPVGCETNLLIYSPGGYRFTDFMRVGVPMNFIMLIVNIVTVYFMFNI